MKHKGLWISLIAVFSTLAIVYFVGAVFFLYYSLPYTNVEGIDQEMGWMKEEQITQIIEDTLPDTLKTYFPDGAQFSIDLNTYRNNERINATGGDIIASQGNWNWPLEILNKHVYSYTTEDFYDSGRIQTEMGNYSALYDSGIPAEDAYIQINTVRHSYDMKEEKEGTKINREDFADTISDIVFGSEVFGSDIEYDFDKEIYIKPEVTTEDEKLSTDYEWLTAIAERTITVDLDGAEEVLNAGIFYDLETLMNSGEIIIDRNYITEYVKRFADEYDTRDKNRKFKNHKGEYISVGQGDEESNYGYILNQEETEELIYNALLSYDTNKVEASWYSKGQSHYGKQNDIGNTYIEVSIAEQHLWYWKDGELFLETDVVTGLPADGRNTSRGVYVVYSEGTHVNLKGQMNGETWDSWVDFWFSVTDSQIGIHDAPWRDAFGGDIYTYNGSHGCINLPREAMELLYNNAGIGTVVVIY